MTKITNESIKINLKNEENFNPNYATDSNPNIEVEQFDDVNSALSAESGNVFTRITKSVIDTYDNIEKIEAIASDGYKYFNSVNTDSFTITLAVKDGENSRLYLFDGDLKVGAITLDTNEKIKDLQYNEENKNLTIQFENGETKTYDEKRLKRSIELAQKYNNSNIGKYYETDGEKVIEVANAELGKPYEWGASGPDTYDCSGFVGYCLTGTHERIGTTYTFMDWPETTNPQPGDICVNENHTGIYVGNGQMIHAPQTGDYIKIGPVQAGMKYVVYPG